ncbi:MAG TPA: AAA family ATPase [Candidatus Wunengus sp. YC60]|uniref:AAA family ATPase n=1 Tax=Candidatus Wunengus sp. YC60 TaxID=3367697 RepID=UPI0040297E3A
MSEGLKFLSAEIKYFKNIKSRVININGMSLLVMGKNGAGKSSFIQALTAMLDVKTRPDEPITKGKPDGEISSIEVVIGGSVDGIEKKYTLHIQFTESKKSGVFTLYNDKGEMMKSPATHLKTIIGEHSVDPTKWLNESKEKKLKTVKQLTGCELDIDKINSEIKDKKAVKKSKKESAEEMESVLKHHGYSQEEIDRYSTPKPVEPIQEELKNISKALEAYSGIETKVKGFKKSIEDSEKRIVETKERIEKLKAQIKDLEITIEGEFTEIEKNKSNLVKGDAWFEKNAKPSVDEINDRLQLANEHNIHHAKIMKHSEQQRSMLKCKEEIATIDTEVTALEKQRGELISKSQLPIPGFSFDDNEIYIDGLPMNETQLNTARLFDIAVDVALAMKPKLKVVFLHEGSLFDSENLKNIIKKIESRGCMAIAEIVTNDDLEVKFFEQEIDE